MGVRGLCKFIDENPRLMKTYDLHDTKIVIDGCNLGHYLYYKMQNYNSYLFGGEYPKYAEEIKNFFCLLNQCGIKEPVVVFDGGWDVTDRLFRSKLEKQRQRLEKVIQSANDVNNVRMFTPIGLYEVYKQVLWEMRIQIVQCDYEGDNQMVSLANELECPLLSDDSDFHIYDLENGFIRLSHMDMFVREKRDGQKRIIKYLKCQIYFAKEFMQYYRLRDTKLLVLYAILMGNDYTLNNFFNHFIYKIIKQEMRHCFQFKDKQEMHHVVLSWLRGCSYETAVEKILRFATKCERDGIKNFIDACAEDYRLRPTSLRNMVENKSLTAPNELVKNTKLIAPCGAVLPAEFVIDFRNGLLAGSDLNIITMHRRFLQAQVENFSSSSSYSCSRYIRQATYGILVQHDSPNIKLHTEACLKHIAEYDRQKKCIEEISVEYLTELKNGKPIPKLSDIYVMPKYELRHFLGDLLGVDKNFFEGIPLGLQLVFGCLVFWLNNCVPKPTTEILNAIFFCIVHLESAMSSRVVSQLQSLSLYEESSLDCEVLHCFCQFQVSVLDAISLNSLLGLPLQFPKLHHIFSGKLLYNVSKALESKSNEEEFIQNMMKDQFTKFSGYRERILNSISFELKRRRIST